MRHIRAIILRAGIGATSIRAAAHFISIFLINAITLNTQIAPPGNFPRPEARVIAQHADRILPLLAALADQASLPYVGGDVSHYITLGAQNPIKYINC